MYVCQGSITAAAGNTGRKNTPQSVVKIRHVLRPMFSSLSQLIGFFSIRCIPTKTPMATTMSGNIMPGIVV